MIHLYPPEACKDFIDAKKKGKNRFIKSAVFNSLSKVIRLYFSSASLGSVIRQKKKSRHFLVEVKPKTCSRAFTRARCLLHVFASSAEWFIWLFTSAVFGQCNSFGFGFTTVN